MLHVLGVVGEREAFVVSGGADGDVGCQLPLAGARELEQLQPMAPLTA